ncbi:MAG: hypothetical protein JRI25_22530, partial [Deltaproteobacteria bacterium]|nr:hypothetical protein [Deltaproteobacteria bacterium]
LTTDIEGILLDADATGGDDVDAGRHHRTTDVWITTFTGEDVAGSIALDWTTHGATQCELSYDGDVSDGDAFPATVDPNPGATYGTGMALGTTFNLVCQGQPGMPPARASVETGS